MSTRFDLTVDLGERSYPIFVQAGLRHTLNIELNKYIDGKNCLIVTDSNVNELYIDIVKEQVIKAGAATSVSVFEAGEAQKHLNTMANIYHDAVTAGLDRTSVIIALGGGVTGDMAGFAAASYMRGIPFIQIPTSLLAMVDSSVGGKTGIDLPEGKNLVGAFWQPDAVLIDTEMLQTLPRRELLCGLAEVVKYAVIMDPDFFETLEKNIDKLLSLDLDFYSEIVSHCCSCKADVVRQDEREGGIRAILNYGHTFGHAIEAIAGFGVIEHGEGVAIGMAMAADTAVSAGMLTVDKAERQERLLEALNLPTTAPALDVNALLKAMESDKKKAGSKKRFVLPTSIGTVEIVDTITDELLLQEMAKRCI